MTRNDQRGKRGQSHLAADIRRAISEALVRGLHDARIKGLVSVTEVRLAPDLSEATVLVSVLPAEREMTTLRGLQHAAPRLRSSVSRSVRLRRVPRLRFEIDHSLKRAAELDRALASAADPEDPAGGEPA